MFADTAGTAAIEQHEPDADDDRVVAGTAMATTAPLRDSVVSGAPVSRALEPRGTGEAPTAEPAIHLGLGTEGARTVLSCRLGETLYEPLMHERNMLVRREGAGLEETEGRRLAFVRWQLEEIELARMAPGLHQLETVLKAQQQLAKTVTGLVEALRDIHPAAVGPRRGR